MLDLREPGPIWRDLEACERLAQLILAAWDEIVERIEARIAAWTFLPEENGEAIQILHYETGEKYEPHFDYFDDKINQALGGHRIATVLMYLSNIKKGGETVFPDSDDIPAQPKDDSWSDCAKTGYAVKPEKGDALLFFNLHPDATKNSKSLHGSCPVIEGEKWSATKWIHGVFGGASQLWHGGYQRQIRALAKHRDQRGGILCAQNHGMRCRSGWSTGLQLDIASRAPFRLRQLTGS
ncbi:hypothetical protein KSP40_PGU014073 [Platanthera guangdongensis]|uniref:Fe2OG dioxygenase domain-containing protein n=1 Tax=Platanthera guangdongensis TaxID=2320717 RepID=A0ABR2MGM3_9ASPA